MGTLNRHPVSLIKSQNLIVRAVAARHFVAEWLAVVAFVDVSDRDEQRDAFVNYSSDTTVAAPNDFVGNLYNNLGYWLHKLRYRVRGEGITLIDPYRYCT